MFFFGTPFQLGDFFLVWMLIFRDGNLGDLWGKHIESQPWFSFLIFLGQALGFVFFLMLFVEFGSWCLWFFSDFSLPFVKKRASSVLGWGLTPWSGGNLCKGWERTRSGTPVGAWSLSCDCGWFVYRKRSQGQEFWSENLPSFWTWELIFCCSLGSHRMLSC